MDDADEPVEKLLIDSHLADLFSAYKHCSIVYKALDDEDARERVQGIQLYISIALSNLVDLGVHSRKRFEELQREYKIW